MTFRDALIAAMSSGDPKPKAKVPQIGLTQDQYIDPRGQEDARRMLSSAFADSMYTLMGTPTRAASTYIPNLPGAVGEYIPGRDSIALNWGIFGGKDGFRPVGARPPTESENTFFSSPERTFTHELAHRLFWRASVGDALGYDDAKPGAYDLKKRLRAVADSVGAAGGKLPGYAGTNNDEHAAEAVSNAIHLLRLTDTMKPGPELPAQVAPMRQQFEQSVPGTAAALDYLLAQPIYQRHPLRVSREVSNPQPDATVALPVTAGGPRKPIAALLNLTPRE